MLTESHATAHEATELVPADNASPVRILVVEDERIVARDLADTLTELGYEVVATAATGEDAICKTRDLAPDLVLMDIHLAGKLDGIDAAARIRDESHVGVVYLTAHSDEAMLHRAKATDPLGYLVKPFRAPEIHCALEIALNRHKTEARRVAQAEEAAMIDELTGLWNRRAWDRFRTAEASRCRRTNGNACIIAVDLDGLKDANDTQGHAAGDELIQRAARSLQRGVRDTDFVARVGGDEFAVLLVDCSEEMGRLVEKRLRERLALDRVAASVGFAHGGRAQDLEQAWTVADHEMYRNKRARKQKRAA